MQRRNSSSFARPIKFAIVLFLLALVMIVTALPCVAWQSDEESASAQQQQGYPVIVDGYEVFRVRQTLGAASAEFRAQRISAALEELAKAPDYDPTKIQANEEGGVCWATSPVRWWQWGEGY